MRDIAFGPIAIDVEASETVTVQPGDTGEPTHTFAEAGSLLVSRHQPGHVEAATVLDITLT